MSKHLAKVREILGNHVYDLSSEKLVQAAMERLLWANSIPFEREVHLHANDIIDFIVDGSLGIEVKLAGSLTQITRQMHRYSNHDSIETLLLVTTKPQLAQLPSSFNNKEISTLVLVANLI